MVNQDGETIITVSRKKLTSWGKNNVLSISREAKQLGWSPGTELEVTAMLDPSGEPTLRVRKAEEIILPDDDK